METENQPQLAETSDFLGTGPELNLDVDDSPEPTTEEVVEDVAEADEPEAVEPEAEETYELPNEQSKVFPPEEIYKFGQNRYGYTQKEIEADPRLQRSLKDQLNSAILIEQQRVQQTAEVEEPTLEDDEPDADLSPTTVQPSPEERAQWLEQIATQHVDQKAVTQFGHNFLVAAGVDPKDPNNAEVLKNAPAIGRELTKGAIDLITTLVPQLVQGSHAQTLESAMPGITEMYQRSLYAQQWEHVAAGMKDANLPKYGSAEFQQAIKNAAAEFPGFEQMVFTDKSGKPLPMHQQIERQYGLLAKHMSGAKVTPADVAKGVETGKRLAEKANAKRVAGKALGAGQSNQQFGTKGADAVMDDLDAAIAAANRDMDPFKPR